MTYDILVAGVGGQGVLSIAAIIAKAAMLAGLSVRQSEVHGMSQRGGGVQAQLRLSDSEIFSDLIPSGSADMILSMEPMESLRYLSYLKKDGTLITAAEAFLNISNYPDIETVYSAIKKLPSSHLIYASELAKQAGHQKSVNMVLIGAALSYLPIKYDLIAQSIHDTFAQKDPRLVEINLQALSLGQKASM